MRAWRNAASCRSDDPTPWLLAITRREAFRRHAARHEDHLAAHAELATYDRTTDEVHDRLDFDALLASLKPLERRLITLRYRDDLTQPAVAKELGMPEGTTKVRLHRLRARLRRTLDLEEL
jgi:RNA polymerase sigma-70 factor (ECF subfamily)